jgi:hypothetical protein
MGRRVADPDVLVAIDDAALTEEEDRGIEFALEQHRKEQTVDASKVRKILEALLKR